MSTAAVETPDVKVPATPDGPRLSKAVRPDGTDFHTRTVPWLPADGAPIPEGGWLVEHPKPGPIGAGSARGYLSAASVETDCAMFRWPARLLLVEPDGAMWTPHPDSFPHKRAAHAWRVVGELPAWRLFGPQGRQVAALIEKTAHLTSAQIEDLSAARDAARRTVRVDAQRAAQRAARVAARDAAWIAVRDAAWGAAWSAARDAAWGEGPTWAVVLDTAQDSAWVAVRDAAGDVVLGWLVKDLISDEDFRTLTGPWEQVMGRSWEVTA